MPERGGAAAPVSAVIFDVGGVLLRPNGRLLADALHHHLGLSLPPDRLSTAWAEALARIDLGTLSGAAETSPSHLDLWLTVAGVPGDLLPVAARPIEELLQAPVDLWTSVVSGAQACLTALRAGRLRLACVSNGLGTVADELRRNELAEFFEVVVDSAIVKIEKPDPRIFWIATDALGLDPRACLYVGDTVSIDVHGARGAGLQACHFDGLGLYPDSAAEFTRIRSFSDLTDMLVATSGQSL